VGTKLCMGTFVVAEARGRAAGLTTAAVAS
jgi:hypothetical protein